MPQFPIHKVTVTYTIAVPHEVDIDDVKSAFNDEVIIDLTLYVEDENGEEESLTVNHGTTTWTEVE